MPAPAPDSGDTAMTGLYILALACEVITVIALWAFGRMFA
jgi:hypothetical protein